MAGEFPRTSSEADHGCGLEGVGGRPIDCKNNPWKYQYNHRPKLCFRCPGNKDIPKTAEQPLPPSYIEFKNIQNSSLDYEQNLAVDNQLKRLMS